MDQMIPEIWGGGQLLAFSALDGKTDYHNGLIIRTAFDDYGFEIKQPQIPGGMGAIVRYTGGRPERLELGGDFFAFYSGGATARGVLADSCNLLLEGPFEISGSMAQVEICRHGGRTLLASRGFLDRDLLGADFNKIWKLRTGFLKNTRAENNRPPVRKALSQMKTQLMSPEGQIRHLWTTPDRWPHRAMWLWDSVFHAIGLRHIDAGAAREVIAAVFDVQQEDGFIPHCASPYHISEVTQPPILGLGMSIVGGEKWIGELAPKLGRYLKWIMANRDSDGAGLVEWQINAKENCRSGESGMDNSPRFDHVLHLDAVDFNSYLARECELMAGFIPAEKEFWMGHHRRLCGLINKFLWSEAEEFYVDRDVDSGRHSDILASTGFLPLFCGAADPEQARKLVAHLNDPESFGTVFRIPSISCRSRRFYRKDMWRGPVWINVNYLVALGLARYGYHDEAKKIVRDTIAQLEKYYHRYGTFFEYYDDEGKVDPPQLLRKGVPKPGCATPFNQVLHDYGWTATLYLEMINRGEWQ